MLYNKFSLKSIVLQQRLCVCRHFKRFASETVEAREPDLATSTASQRSTGYYLFESGTHTGVRAASLRWPMVHVCLSPSCDPGLPKGRKYSISAELCNRSSGILTTIPAPCSSSSNFLASKQAQEIIASICPTSRCLVRHSYIYFVMPSMLCRRADLTFQWAAL